MGDNGRNPEQQLVVTENKPILDFGSNRIVSDKSETETTEDQTINVNKDN